MIPGVRIALVDSGIGMLSTAAALHRARPDADLVLSMDPDHMPWGRRSAEEITERLLAGARAAVAEGEVAAIAVPCNTASVYGLARLRQAYEPEIPVIGTVPPVKPATERGVPFAVWSTPATSRSAYQRDLIRRFAPGAEVYPVACTGLAEAVESARQEDIAATVAAAAARTPPSVGSVVLGCTHYDLVSGEITAALGPAVEPLTAAAAVAAQTLRRVGVEPRPEAPATGRVRVLASGRPQRFPGRALRYPPGAALAARPALGEAGRRG